MADWRFNIAYNAALQIATAALAASGYQATRGSHHYWVIQSLTLTLGLSETDVHILDRFRKKRNVADYERVEVVSDSEVEEMIALAQRLRLRVEEWICKNHPELAD